ncbi:CheR family methyltransferase [Candidatus Riflebacteria bacterium]
MSGKKKQVKTKVKKSRKESVTGKKTVKSKPGKHPIPPVVGMGASAGGLEAFKRFFNKMPVNNGMAFVVVAHLAPDHVSILPELLQQNTEMEVHKIEDGMQIAANSVYVIPPNKNLAISNGTLKLLERGVSSEPPLLIDYFFRSLAKDQGRNAVCIILSGTGTDGSQGVKEIKGEMGLVMAQDGKSAAYPGMPFSAESTGLVDYILAPEKMPGQLLKYIKHPTYRPTRKKTVLEEKVPDALNKIIRAIKVQTGHDFSGYKLNTICRRIERRMNVHQIGNVSNYLNFLRENKGEVEQLFKELLIGVTNFFRDPESFKVLSDEIFPMMMKEKSDTYQFRIWVPGCSTGEEVYSIAIAFKECMEEMKKYFSVQIFATDIDGEAIDYARSGIYPVAISEDIKPRYLKYFIKEDSVYRIKKEIREMIVFAPHNVIDDPPFSRMDLISCRNLLIYLDAKTQEKLLSVFEYSLKQQGILMLGASETIGHSMDFFATVSRKWKIFRAKKSSIARQVVTEFSRAVETEKSPLIATSTGIKENEKTSIKQLLSGILLEHYSPACVLINSKGEIQFIHGRTGKYLEPAPGNASMNILKMARQGIKLELSSGIRKAVAKKQRVTLENLRLKSNGDFIALNLVIHPIVEATEQLSLFAVIFEETSRVAKQDKSKGKRDVKEMTDGALLALQQELKFTREDLQTTIEELETSNEELKSTNEELQSTNEELQSTNEEMETSKEELQSLNEELTTVNEELQERIEELSRTNDDMKNLLDSNHIATIFLDNDLNIKRFTPKSMKIFNLIKTDVDRPLAHIVSKLKYKELQQDSEKVLSTLIPKELQVEGHDGEWYKMTITPYRTVANVIQGAVMTFEKITRLMNLNIELNKAMKKLAGAQAMAKIGYWELDLHTEEMIWSNEVYRIFGVKKGIFKPAVKTIESCFHPGEKWLLTEEFIKKNLRRKKFELEHYIINQANGKERKIQLFAELLVDNNKKPVSIIGTLQDITEHKKSKKK